MHLITKCAGQVFITEETQAHLRAHPDVWKYLVEAVGKVVLPTDSTPSKQIVHFNRPIGFTGCVTAHPIGYHESATFARRINRPRPSRVAVNVQGKLTSTMVIKLRPTDRRGVYALYTAYIGQPGRSEPWQPRCLKSLAKLRDSLGFWTTHALVYDPAVMDPVMESTWREVIERAQANRTT